MLDVVFVMILRRKEKVVVTVWDFIDKHASKRKTPTG
jgi:hypothetical protein